MRVCWPERFWIMDSHSHESSLARKPLLRATHAHRRSLAVQKTRLSNVQYVGSITTRARQYRQQLLLARFCRWLSHATASSQRQAAGTRARPQNATKDLRQHRLLATYIACDSVAILSREWIAILAEAAPHGCCACALVGSPSPFTHSRVDESRHVHPLVRRVRDVQSRSMPSRRYFRKQLSQIPAQPCSGDPNNGTIPARHRDPPPTATAIPRQPPPPLVTGGHGVFRIRRQSPRAQISQLEILA